MLRRLSSLVRDWRYFLAFLVMALALFWGGAQPGAGKLFTPPLDKWVHGTVYFVMTGLLGLGARLALPGVAAAVLVLGGLDEWHQLHVPGRVPSVHDWLADAAGVLAALALLYASRRTAGN